MKRLTDVYGKQKRYLCMDITHQESGVVLRTVNGDSLVGVDLEEALLKGADLREADLSGARLKMADLCFADLSGAILDNASLEGATIDGAVLTRASLDQTVWTDGKVCAAGSFGDCR